MSKVGQVLTENLDFPGHLSTFGAKNKKNPKVGLLSPKKNAQTVSKQLANNFGKCQNFNQNYAHPPNKKVTLGRGVKIQTINHAKESHSNQGDPHGEC